MSATQGAGPQAAGRHPGVPLLADLMPWSAGPLRLGRRWVMAPDQATLRARWQRLVGAEGADRARLFAPSRARTVHTAVAQLPGQATATGRLARGAQACPEPVRVLHAGFDQQWLLPDHRLIDAARPELWRVAGPGQVFVVEQPAAPRGPGPAVVPSAVLPDGLAPNGRPGRIRPLYRRPDAAEPNLAPGLLAHLAQRLGTPVTAEDLLAWTTACARHENAACVVPLTAEPALWERGVALGSRLVDVFTRGAHSGERVRMPGGRRPYVRSALPGRGLPARIGHEAQEEALYLDAGRIAPVARAAWEYEAAGVPVLARWFEVRTGAAGEPGSLSAIVPEAWPAAWTSDLLELVTVVSLLAEARAEQRALVAAVAAAEQVGTAELREAGVLPVSSAARRPASVLDRQEEGPEGQFALW
ncbi:type ISP restriction/modification enzyme [Streptomyces sp. NPDC059740]|uniref:type ISP restriction/modification enzyme n=1 Tax=Streptomyces sp. NPDC059740 TaxID=3346926 RepID=UPI00364D6859